MGKLKAGIEKFRYNWNRPSTDDNLSYKEIGGFTLSAMGQDIFWGLRGNVKDVYVAAFNIDAVKFGKLGLFSGIWDAINDPIMGILIDRTDTKWGKLRPYMLFTAFPIALFTILQFFNPTFISSSNARFVFLAVVYILWEMSYTISDVPFGALPSVITSNTVQRTRLITVSKYGSEIGLLLPSIINFIVQIVGMQYLGTTFFIASIFLSTLGAVLFSTSFFTTKERVPPSPNKQSLGDIWKVLKSGRPMIVLMLSELMTTISAAASYTSKWFFYFRFKNGIGWKILKIFDSESEGLGLQALMSTFKGVPTFLLMALTPKVAKRFGMKTLVVISALAKAFAYISIYIVGVDSTPKLIYMIFILTIVGLPDNMISVVRKTLSSDALDYVEWKTGERAEGLMGSLMGFAVKLKDALVVFFGGYALKWVGLAGVDNLETDGFLSLTPDINKLFIMFTLVPALAAILQALPYLFYNFTGDRQKQILEELAVTRAERRERLISEGYDFDSELTVKDIIKKGADKK